MVKKIIWTQILFLSCFQSFCNKPYWSVNPYL